MGVLSEKAVFSVLSVSVWEARKFDKKVSQQSEKAHGAEAGTVRATKKLIDDESLQAIIDLANKARLRHNEITQPWIDKGPRILNNKLIAQHTAEFHKMKLEFEALVRVFESRYPALLRAAPGRLNGMFDKKDFPDPENVASRFEFKISFRPCPDENDFRIRIGDEQLADFKAEMESALQAQKQDTADRIIKVVGNMRDRLRDYGKADPNAVDSNGKKRGKRAGAFRDTLVSNVEEVSRLLAGFNLDDDPRLTAINEDIERELCAYPVEDLRDDVKKRTRVRKSADKILKDVAAFMS